MQIQISLSAARRLSYDSAKIGDTLTRKFKNETFIATVLSKPGNDIELGVDGLGVEMYESHQFDSLVERGVIKRATEAQINKHGGNKRQTRHRASADAHRTAEKKLQKVNAGRMRDQKEFDLTRAFAMVEEAKNHSLSKSQKDNSLNAARDFAVDKQLPLVRIESHELYPSIKAWRVTRPQPFWDVNNRDLEPTGFRFVLPNTDKFTSLTENKKGGWLAVYGDGSKRWQKKVVRTQAELRDFFRTIRANF